MVCVMLISVAAQWDMTGTILKVGLGIIISDEESHEFRRDRSTSGRMHEAI